MAGGLTETSRAVAPPIPVERALSRRRFAATPGAHPARRAHKAHESYRRSAAKGKPETSLCQRHPTGLIQSLSPSLNEAYDWLFKRRATRHHNNDIWDLRANWSTERASIDAQLAMGTYRFSPLTRVTTASGEEVDVWCARDALVLKALALALEKVLPRSRRCSHLRGHGGLKGAVRAIDESLSAFSYVLRTDVKSYYASIDHFRLLDRLERYIADRRVINLISQYLRRSAERGGCFWDFERGISLGCPLSPLMGAFYLHELDSVMGQSMARGEVFYIRYMDDILVLARTRWGLRRAVSTVNGILQTLDLTQHPDKTFIGRIERGFDFLGYHFSRDANGIQYLSLAAKTIANFQEKLHRLYEQARHAKTYKRSEQDAWRCNDKPKNINTEIERYTRRWLSWARGGVGINAT